MTERSARELLREVNGAGLCARPIRLMGVEADRETGELRHKSLLVACKDRRASVCPACSYLYKADAWILVSAGLTGGKGVDPVIGHHPRLFVTLTAPSFGPVHRSTASVGSCHPRPGRPTCAHGVAMTCRERHDHDDSRLGTPMCRKCFDYERAVLWNLTSPRLWQRTVVRLRQRLAATASLSLGDFRRECCLTYVKVAELQRRGLVHFHAVVRLDGGQGRSEEPPGWLTAPLVAEQLGALRPSIVVKGPGGTHQRWGHQLAAQELAQDSEPNRVAAYVAKYATKTAEEGEAIARPFRSRRAIERAQIPEHARTLVLTAWDLAARPQFQGLRLREHAHTFGFPGQLLTKSRSYSTTFRELREARARHMAGEDTPVLLEGSFGYLGRGYEDPRGEDLARFLHGERVTYRTERSRSRKVPSSSREPGSEPSGSPDPDRDTTA